MKHDAYCGRYVQRHSLPDTLENFIEQLFAAGAVGKRIRHDRVEMDIDSVKTCFLQCLRFICQQQSVCRHIHLADADVFLQISDEPVDVFIKKGLSACNLHVFYSRFRQRSAQPHQRTVLHILQTAYARFKRAVKAVILALTLNQEA